jgi:hypothetical protein
MSAYGGSYGPVQVPLSERTAMSDKSPRQSSSKKSDKTLKQKRAEKRDKAAGATTAEQIHPTKHK